MLSASGVIGGPTDAPMSSLSDPSPTDAGPIRLADAGRAHGSPCPFIFLARRERAHSDPLFVEPDSAA